VPLSDIIELTGGLSVAKRKEAYRNHRVFFMTPQTLENDMKATIEGKADILDVNRIVLLIIDEAHRATGAYAYCNLINYLEKAKVGFRIVSLSATPVSKLDCLQAIIDVLRVS